MAVLVDGSAAGGGDEDVKEPRAAASILCPDIES
jgi:hypothetical protein